MARVDNGESLTLALPAEFWAMTTSFSSLDEKRPMRLAENASNVGVTKCGGVGRVSRVTRCGDRCGRRVRSTYRRRRVAVGGRLIRLLKERTSDVCDVLSLRRVVTLTQSRRY